jgi:DNA-binding protein HU-beta
MNKSDLINVIADKTNITKKTTNEILNAILETISETLEKGDKIALQGFGSFKVNERKEREGRHPKTGEKIKISACKVVKFSRGAALKEKVQDKKK